MVKNSPANAGDAGLIPRWRPLEKEMANHSRVLAWRIPRTKEPGGLQSMGSQRVGRDWSRHWYMENGSSILDARRAQLPVEPRYVGIQQAPKQVQGQRVPLRGSGDTALSGHVFRLNWNLPEHRKKTLNISRKMNDQRARLYSLSLTCLCISQVLTLKMTTGENVDRATQSFFSSPSALTHQ